MSKSKIDYSSELLQFFRKRNRPFSLQDVVTAFQNEMTKSVVQKGIDRLIGKGQLMEKCFGKTKIYFLDQKDSLPVGPDEVHRLDQELDNANRELSELKNKLKTKEALYVSLTSGMSMDDLDAQLKVHEKKLEELRQKWTDMRPSNRSKRAKDKEGVNIGELHRKLTSETRKRKRIAVDIVESILEGYPKSKKALLEEIGIDHFN